MATPKLKVYRLDKNYTDNQDNDIQSLQNDELLPVIPKNLNVFNTQEMIGIKERSDARMVIESEWQLIEIPFDLSDIQSQMTFPVSCDGWVMGKGNFQLYLQKAEQNPANTPDPKNNITGIPDDYILIDKNYWDCELSVKKRFGKYLDISDFENGTSQNSIYSTENKLFEGKTSQREINNEIVNGILFQNVTELWLNEKYYGIEVDVNNEYTGGKLKVFLSTELTTNIVLYLDQNENEISSINSKYYLQSYKNFVGAEEFHQKDEMVFKIGKWITEVWKKQTSGPYNPFITNQQDTSCLNKIYLRYKKYREFGSIDVFNNPSSSQISIDDMMIYNENNLEPLSSRNNPSSYRVPFGNIYNGNKQGRYVPSGNEKMKYYEGNYLYKKKILPLRYKVAQENEFSSSSEFDSDVQIINGSCEFDIDKNWYLDGLLKPIVFQRILVDIGNPHERKIFKQLQQENQFRLVFQYNQTLQQEDSLSYKFSFVNDYYLMNDGIHYSFPKEMFLIYNLYDDYSNNIFDFDYDYKNYDLYKDISVDFKCGYANRGYLYAFNALEPSLQSSLDSGNEYLPYYYKIEKLAVLGETFGYYQNKDLLLNKINESDANWSSEILDFYNLHTNAKIYVFNINDEMFSDDKPMKIYIDGQKIWEYNGESLTSYYDVYYENKFFMIADMTDNELIKDLMVVYYKKYKMFPYSNNLSNENPIFLGYRIPCYEKVKESNYFVSSFPNWVKGHLNNDLDVFVGNTTYSGTDTSGTDTSGIYPCYKKDGWYPLYAEGAVKFNEKIVQFDYFDLYNYADKFLDEPDNLYNDLSSAPVVPNYYSGISNYRLYYQKVRYNVAHYDGVYSVLRGHLSNYTIQNGKSYYALLEDQDYTEAIDKKWLIRKDNQIKRLFESQQKEFPEISNSTTKEETEVFSEFNVQGRNKSLLRINTNDDRIKMISYVPTNSKNQVSGNGIIICLNRSYKDEPVKIISEQELSDEDIRIHITFNNYTLLIGKETLQKSINELNGINQLFQGIPRNENYVQVQWWQLPDMNDLYTDLSIQDIQNNPITVNEDNNPYNKIGIMRYKYSNQNWEYDVYFEVFSYRYINDNNEYKGSGKSPVNTIEFAVYRVLK